MGGGPGVEAGEGRREDVKSRNCRAVGRPLFPMEDVEGTAVDNGEDDLNCIPCDEEEQA